MFNTSRSKGYAFSVSATITGAAVYILSKAALIEISLPQFGVYWFLSGMIWNALYSMRSKEARKMPPLNKSIGRTLLLLGGIEIIATTTLYAAIFVADDAAVPSFLRNLEFIFVALLGVFLLKERFSRVEIAGVFLTIIGALIISYHKGMTFGSYMSGASGLMLISSVSYATRTIIAKKHIAEISPTLLAFNRALFIFIFALIILVIRGESLLIPATALLSTILGAFFGPFLTSTAQYSSLKYIEASKGAIIQSTTPLFVLVGGYLYFERLPLYYQIFGGILTIAGTVLLIMGRDFFKKKGI